MSSFPSDAPEMMKAAQQDPRRARTVLMTQKNCPVLRGSLGSEARAPTKLGQNMNLHETDDQLIALICSERRPLT